VTGPATHTESSYAWIRLDPLALMTIAARSMYSMSVALPRSRTEFGIAARPGLAFPTR